jgi:hypothetical protein
MVGLDLYFPGSTDALYELWEEGGAKIRDLPAYASQMRIDEHFFIDAQEYVVERITHELTVISDEPGPPPIDHTYDYDYVTVKIYVTIL